eukprot:scaffold405_cov243-Pinguiococcus_pyrenoidosus.AAC.23
MKNNVNQSNKVSNSTTPWRLCIGSSDHMIDHHRRAARQTIPPLPVIRRLCQGATQSRADFLGLPSLPSQGDDRLCIPLDCLRDLQIKHKSPRDPPAREEQFWNLLLEQHLPPTRPGLKSILLWDVFAVHRDEHTMSTVRRAHPDLFLLYVPSNCTEIAQPLNISFNGPLKGHILAQKNAWLVSKLRQHRCSLELDARAPRSPPKT